MTRLTEIFLILITALTLTSCTRYKYNRDYRMAEDGLIYKYGTDELYTGLVCDTSDVIITFEVVNGVKNGTFISFYLNGEYEKYGLIENDQNIGEWSYFYPSGQVESTGSFVENKPNGKWVSYYPNGEIKAEGLYKEGSQHGKWHYFNDKGELINVLIFQNGILEESQIKI